MNARSLGLTLIALLGWSIARAQTPVSDDFTYGTTANQWLFYNGACLTAGSTSVTGSIGASTGSGRYTFPGCVTIESSYYGEDLVGGVDGYLGSSSAPSSLTTGTPDPTGQGALRFTNGSPGGYSQNGAIVSGSTFPTGKGIQIQFETVTYRGDSGGAGRDGADGISFYLLDGCMPVQGGTAPAGCSANPAYGTSTFPGIGSWGGSLAYTCSNVNPNYDGLVGAYLGLGIDEYGNFLNGYQNTLGESGSTSIEGTYHDNTATGGLYQPGRIGLRGAGSVAWQALTNAYGTNLGTGFPYYPASLTGSQRLTAVQKTCETGHLWNFSSASSPIDEGPASLTNTANTAGILDYAAIPSAYSVLSGVKIANESATTRGKAIPILYKLQITQDGLLSLSYSVDGGALQEVIKDQDITTSNGPLPSSFRFGFAGSTGGSDNIHEILCFKAQPASLSLSSAGVNQKQSAKVQTGAFTYFSFYDPDDWTGRLTANALETDSSGNLTIASTPLWDASCVLTGGSCAATGGSTSVEAPSSRVILTWNGTQGIPFEWSSLTTAQQAALDSTDSTQTANRLDYLRGDRTNEVSTSGTCPAESSSLPCFRRRDGVLGDIVDSSPTWVGPPIAPYTATWSDRLYPTASMSENTGTQTYAQYVSAEETRENVVYVGANDGLLHGFRSGAYNADGSFNSSAPNDGYEVLAYMPGSAISGASLETSSGPPATYASVVDTIHGTDPTKSNAVTTNLDYSNTQYGHSFFVDQTPGTGDLFYDGTWHTWLVGGLGPGGAAIYALDVTSPSSFSESNAANLVVGEWNAQTISCENVASCGQDLGDTYGTPEIRRLHNGTWGVLFGNGFGSASGDAGIYVLTVAPDGTETIYYLSTGTAGTNNGIAYVTAADLDQDHVTDYVYAGDLHGNVWRFDLTSNNPANWGITRCLDAGCTVTSNAPLFTTQSGQPITTQLVVASGSTTAGSNTLIIAFGTGQKTPFTTTGATSYASSSSQALYGVWDWALANWNSKSPTHYAALTPSGSGLSAPYTIPAPSSSSSALAQQAFTINTSVPSTDPAYGDRDISVNAPVCWQGTSACSTGSNDQFGWYATLPGGTSSLPEQIVFSPEVVNGAFIVNSTIPPVNNLLSCSTSTETGYTYALSVLSGGAFNNFFPHYDDYIAAGVATNASGTSFPVTTASGQHWLVFQTYAPGATPPSPLEINVASNSSGRRLTWTQLR
jgi:type IV pilus assembly protein PilY1